MFPSSKSKTPMTNLLVDEAVVKNKFDEAWELFIKGKRKEGLETLKIFKEKFKGLYDEKTKDFVEKTNTAKRYLLFFNKLFPMEPKPKANSQWLFLHSKGLIDEIYEARNTDNLEFILNGRLKTFVLQEFQKRDRQIFIKKIIDCAHKFEKNTGEKVVQIMDDIFRALNLNLKIRANIWGNYAPKPTLLLRKSKTETFSSLKSVSDTISERKDETTVWEVTASGHPRGSLTTTHLGKPVCLESTSKDIYKQSWLLFKEGKRSEALDLLKNFIIELQRSFKTDKTSSAILDHVYKVKTCIIFFDAIFPLSFTKIPTDQACLDVLRIYSYEFKNMSDLRYSLGLFLDPEIIPFFRTLLEEKNRQEFIYNLMRASRGAKRHVKQTMSKFFEAIDLEANLRDSFFKKPLILKNIPEPETPFSEEDLVGFAQEVDNLLEDPDNSLSHRYVNQLSRLQLLNSESKNFNLPCDSPRTSISSELDFQLELSNETDPFATSSFFDASSDGVFLNEDLIKIKYDEAWLLFKMGRKEDAISLLEYFSQANKQSLNEEMTTQINRAITCFQFLNEHFSYDPVVPEYFLSREFQPEQEMTNANRCAKNTLNAQAQEFMPTTPEMSSSGEQSSESFCSLDSSSESSDGSSISPSYQSEGDSPSYPPLFRLNNEASSQPKALYLYPSPKIPSSNRRSNSTRGHDLCLNKDSSPVSSATTAYAFWPNTPKSESPNLDPSSNNEVSTNELN